MKRNDEMWMKKLDILKDYIETHHKFPTTNCMHNGIDIGSWLRNQISAKNRGELAQDRIEMLNNINQYWFGTKKEKDAENQRLVFEHFQKTKPNMIIQQQVPIDVVCENEQELHICLANNIFTCEDLLTHDGGIYGLHTSIRRDCYQQMFTWIDTRYVRLIKCIFGISIDVPFKENKHFLNSLAVRSAEEMRQIVDSVMSDKLTEREQKVLRLRFGLDDGKPKFLDEVGKVFNVTRDRIRQIESKALRSLRHPSSSRILSFTLTNTILDKIELNDELRATLYRAGIDNEEKIFALSDALSQSNFSASIFDYLKESIIKIKEEERKAQEKVEAETTPDEQRIKELPIDEIGLSIRAYNCLRRTGIITVGDLEKRMENMENMCTIRNLGRKCLNEIINTVNNLYHEEKYKSEF